jgi:hypothetical protein
MYRSDPTTSHKSQNHLPERKVVPPTPPEFPRAETPTSRENPCDLLRPAADAIDRSPDLSPPPSTGAERAASPAGTSSIRRQAVRNVSAMT